MKRLVAAGVTAICAALVLPAAAAEVRDGRIAFGGYDAHSDSHELYSMAPDGSARINLTSNFGAEARGPRVYSPDGRWIAFGCTEPGDEHRPFPTDVCVVRDGAKHRKPVRITSLKGVERPAAFSPDSKWIVFAGNDSSGHSSVYIVMRNGRHLTKLTDHHTLEAEHPTFTPDGKRILFDAVLGDDGGGIYAVDPDGSHLTRLIANDNLGSDRFFTLAIAPLVSPDGSQLLFFGYAAEDPTYDEDRDLFVSDLDGGNVVRLTSDKFENETTAGFSADGSLIAYAAGGQIWTVRPDGTDDHVAVDGAAAKLDQVAWAPSGSRLVFRMKQPQAGSEIATATPGGSPDPVTDTKGIQEELPIWAAKR